MSKKAKANPLRSEASGGLFKDIADAWKHAWWQLLLCSIVLGALVFMSFLGEGEWSGPAGIFVSALGLLVALLIFLRQRSDSWQTHTEIMDSQTSIHEELEKFTGFDQGLEDGASDVLTVDDASVKEGSSLPDSPEGKFAAFSEVLRLSNGRAISVAGLEGVAIDLLSKYAEIWPEGNLTPALSEVVGVARKAGKGNNSWYLLLSRDNGGKEVWRLSSGGHGKAGQYTLTQMQ